MTTIQPRLEAVRSASELPAELVQRLGAYIESAPDEQLFRMSPLAYARACSIPEQQAIDLFLHATAAGILDFSWGVICPGCASFLTTRGALRALAEGRRCGFCQVPVHSRLDENVEVAFTVSPQVRRLRFHDPHALDMRGDGLALFFSPSLPPDSRFHTALRESVLHADRLEPGRTSEISLGLAPGRYLLVAPASHSLLHFEVAASGPPLLEADLLDGRVIPERATLGEDGTIRLRSRSAHVAGFLVLRDPTPPPEERCPEMVPPAHRLLPHLTGKQLITSQSFLELFRAESIPSEGGLELKSVTVLFTDLRGSTEMYEQLGDLHAFDLVRKHFTTLRRIVAGSGGAVVKTIGDAIMASFAEPVSALGAAVTMDREVGGVDPGLTLKIGLHCGPCIAVELNERLDYFGRTVNIAARVQSLAGAHQILCTDPVYDAPGAAELVSGSGLRAERNEAALKGIAGSVPVVRLHRAA